MSKKMRPGIMTIVWNNFISSFKKAERPGAFIGQDTNGYKYYEEPASRFILLVVFSLNISTF